MTLALVAAVGSAARRCQKITIACGGFLAVTVAGCDVRYALPDTNGGASVTSRGDASAPPASVDAAPPSSTSDAAPPSPTLDAGPPWMPPDGGFPLTMPCTDVIPEATIVYSTGEPGPAQQGLGGPLEDGVYDLTSMIRYGGTPAVPGTPDRETVRISVGGTRLEYISGYYGFSIALALAPANGILNDTEICPADNSYLNMFVGPQYTAAPGQFITGNGTGYLKVFSKRP